MISCVTHADLDAVRAAERERCCRAVCEHCRAGVPVLRTDSGGWRHDDDYGSPCRAAGIRNLPPEAP